MIKSWCAFIWLFAFTVFGITIPALANHDSLRVDNFSTLPDSNTREFRTDSRKYWEHEWYQLVGRHFSPFVYSGGIHPISNTLTSDAFATEAFVPERINQTATAITYVADPTDTCWGIVSADNNGISGWIRVGTTSYYYRCGITAEPTLPANSTWLMQVSISNSAITTVVNKQTRHPYLQELSNTLGGANLIQDIEQRAGATFSSFIYSGCTPTVPVASLTLAAFACTGFVLDSSIPPRLIPVVQDATTLGPLNGGNGVYWLILDFSRTRTIPGWTRNGNSHFLWQLAGTEPVIPVGTQLFNEVEVGGGIITTVAFRGNAYAIRPSLIGMIPDVKEYGAKCDGVLNDTRAFVATLAKSLLIAIPRASTCVVSPIILKGGTISGSGQAGLDWGIVGAGVDSSEIVGLASATGVLIMAGDASAPAGGYRRFRLEHLKITGHTGFSSCLQIGNAGLGGDGTLVLGKIHHVEVTGCSGAPAGLNARGIFVRNSVSLEMDNVYVYGNAEGIVWGETNGVGAITTQRISHSQSRVNTENGFVIYTGQGFTFDNFISESNGVNAVGYGGIIRATTGATLPDQIAFNKPHFEGNRLGSLLLTSDNTPSVVAPGNVVFNAGVYNKGTNADNAAVTIQDGQDITFWKPFFVGDEAPVKLLVTPGVLRVTVWYQYRAGAGEPPSYGDAVTQIDSLYNTDRAGLDINGQVLVDVKVAGTGVTLLSKDFGSSTRGPTIAIGRNSSAGLESAAIFRLTERLGTEYHFWVDNAGDLRILGANSPPSVADTAGTVVGTQTSSLAEKNLGPEFTDWKLALSELLRTPVYNFTYKDGKYNNEVFTGIVTDFSPLFGMDREPMALDPATGNLVIPEHAPLGASIVDTRPEGKSLNQVSLNGYLILAIKELERRLAIIEGR